jgi:2'-5' RNA ligase
MRLFAAVSLPQDAVGTLSGAVAELAAACPGLRPVRPDALHVTLRFYGDLLSADTQALREKLGGGALRTAAFTATLGGAGQFPPHGTPRVLYAGFVSGSEDLVALWREVCVLSDGYGEPPEVAYTPHVTLARSRRDGPRPRADSIRRLWETLDGLRIPVPVQGITLYASQLLPKGPRYTVVEEVTCAPSR